MSNKIKIVTGKIQTGKTTRLFVFANSHKSVDGILSPVVNNKRMLYHLSSKTIKEFETSDHSKNIISVGKYDFLAESFNWANNKINKSFLEKPEWLIIDEIGKLELKGLGLHPSVNTILSQKNNEYVKIILVIRDYLLSDALDFYQIQKDQYEIITI